MRKELKIGIGLWMVAGLAYVFLKLPAAKFFADPELARIVALHLPCAYVAVTASWMSAWHGWKYLQKRELIDDARSASGAGLALLFCALTRSLPMCSGEASGTGTHGRPVSFC
jgi:hypothetical protein